MFGLNIEKLLQRFGILAVGGIVFAESGLLIGFFLPGDTLLLSAGVFAAQAPGKFLLVELIVVTVLAAIIGDNVGYSIGRRMGPRLFKKKDSLFFRHENVQRAEAFYEKHGGKTIILARFLPVIRTFAPVVAGVGKMPRQRFMLFNIVGGTLWGTGIIIIGYLVGQRIPNLDKYILPVFAAVTVLTFGPALYHLFKDKDSRRRFSDKIKLSVRNIFLNKKIG